MEAILVQWFPLSLRPKLKYSHDTKILAQVAGGVGESRFDQAIAEQRPHILLS